MVFVFICNYIKAVCILDLTDKIKTEHESDSRSMFPTHIPLDEVPGLLRGRVVAGVVVQHFGDDLGHLFI